MHGRKRRPIFTCARHETQTVSHDLHKGTFSKKTEKNNCFVKILKPSRSKKGQVQETVSFREYLHINEPIEIIFTVKSKEQKSFLQTYLHKINYFGKRGCFFQFLEYKDEAKQENIKYLNDSILTSGLIQECDDFNEKLTFEHVNNYGGKSSVKREKQIMILPLARKNSSKSYTHYQCI